jgi:hypothetical protein
MSLVLRAAAVACFVVAVAGCTTAALPSAPATTAVTAASPSSVAATSASVAPTAPGSASPGETSPTASPTAPTPTPPAAPPSGGGGLAGCATRDLQVKVGTAEGAAGSIYQNIDFTNISATACTLYGYPGVSLAAGVPVTQVGAAASRSTAASAAVVTLGAGQTANALLRVTEAGNYPAGTCKPKATTYLQIYPPGQTTPTYLQYTSTGCTSSAVNLLSIGVMQPGAGS